MGRRIDVFFGRLLGFAGGLVCAGAMSAVWVYARLVFDVPFLWFLAACAASVMIFPVLGVAFSRYFGCFALPVILTVIAIFGNPDGGDAGVEFEQRRVFFAGVWLLLGLLGLAVGALTQLHVVFAAGLVLFLGFAIFGPMAFPGKATPPGA